METDLVETEAVVYLVVGVEVPAPKGEVVEVPAPNGEVVGGQNQQQKNKKRWQKVMDTKSEEMKQLKKCGISING